MQLALNSIWARNLKTFVKIRQTHGRLCSLNRPCAISRMHQGRATRRWLHKAGFLQELQPRLVSQRPRSCRATPWKRLNKWGAFGLQRWSAMQHSVKCLIWRHKRRQENFKDFLASHSHPNPRQHLSLLLFCLLQST